MLCYTANGLLSNRHFPRYEKGKNYRSFRKKDRQDMQNYRLISILSSLYKILKKLMYNRLLSFLKKHNALTNVQHGFMENKSSETASHSFRVCVQEVLDRHLQVVGIFIDLSKAYDIINHNILHDKLDSYGVSGSSNMWFKSYLTNRTQFVEISQTDISNHTWHRHQSSLRVTAHGVPQGSILGPLLFLVYMKDLPFNIQEAKLVLYADDTKYIRRW